MGMYIYYRQCHRTLKPAAVFPIEVELGINLGEYSRAGITGESHDVSNYDAGTRDQDNEQSQRSIQQDDPALADDLLLDLGIAESVDIPAPRMDTN